MKRVWVFALILVSVSFGQELSGTAVCTALSKAKDIIDALRYIVPGFLFISGIITGGILFMKEKFKEGGIIGVALVIFAVLTFYIFPFLKTGIEKLSGAIGCS